MHTITARRINFVDKVLLAFASQRGTASLDKPAADAENGLLNWPAQQSTNNRRNSAAPQRWRRDQSDQLWGVRSHRCFFSSASKLLSSGPASLAAIFCRT